MQAGSENQSYNFKVVLLGEGCVGKTSLVLRYVDDRFNHNHITTLQASFLSKKLNINGKRISLSIWDTAGQERFHALGPIYYRSSNGALLVYDVTDEDSFRKVKNWVKELKRQLGSDIVLTIVGNKVDLNNINVSLESAEQYAESVGAKHFHTSAKENIGVEELFYQLTNMMIETSDAKQRNNASTLKRNNSRRSENVLIVEENGDQPDEDSNGNYANSRCCARS